MSAVWRYYNVDDNNIGIANCEICKVGIARGGKEKATFNTTNLIRHLKNKHPTQYSEFTQATQPKTSQLTLQESLKRREKMPRDSAKAQDITAKIAQMIAMSDLPFAFVENPGFLMLMEHVELDLKCRLVTISPRKLCQPFIRRFLTNYLSCYEMYPMFRSPQTSGVRP